MNIESEQFLKIPSYNPIIGRDLAESVLKTLIGTSRTIRMGPMPSDDTIEILKKNISYKICNNEPLEITSAWGACKTLPGYKHGVDLAEVITLNQYDAINNSLKKIYEPGVNFNIFLSDSYYEYLYGSNDLMVEYCNDMERLIASYTQMNSIRTSTTHDLLGDEIVKKCAHNYNLLRKYWYDSEQYPEEIWTNLESYKDLISAGWIGTLPPALRDFYLKRMQGLYPEESKETNTDKVIKFFSYGLVLKQYNVLKRENPNECTADFCLLKVPPPEMPKQLHGNRLRVRSNGYQISKQSSPPWTIEGALKIQSNGLLKPIFISDINFARNSLRSVTYKDLSEINVYE